VLTAKELDEEYGQMLNFGATNSMTFCHKKKAYAISPYTTASPQEDSCIQVVDFSELSENSKNISNENF